MIGITSSAHRGPRAARRAVRLAGAVALAFCLGAAAAEVPGVDPGEGATFPDAGAPPALAELRAGIGFLHDFDYARARGAFRRAQAADPRLVLAWWGESMTHARPLWGEEDVEAGRAALGRLAATPAARRARAASAREARYLDALDTLWRDGDRPARYAAYRDAMRRLAGDYPGDIDATLFHALALLGADPSSEPDAAARAEAAAILERVRAAHPRHAGAAHYLIHAYDDPANAHRALPAARAYEAAGRTSPHALHMPAHVYLRLGLWDDALRANQRAWAASVNDPDHGPDLHSLEWLHYVCLQRGEWRRAATYEATLERIASESGEALARLHLERVRARAAIETAGPARATLPAGGPFLDHHLTRANALLAAGVDAARHGDAATAREAGERLATLRGAAHGHGRTAWAGSISVMEAIVEGLAALARGDAEGSTARLREAVAIEHTLAPPHGPPNPFAPAGETLGGALLALGRFEAAAAAFDAVLRTHPGRAAALLGRARAALGLGDAGTARAHYERLLANGREGDAHVPWLIEARAFRE